MKLNLPPMIAIYFQLNMVQYGCDLFSLKYGYEFFSLEYDENELDLIFFRNVTSMMKGISTLVKQ